MQTQIRYESEIRSVLFGDRTITIENLTPILSPKERERRRREVESRLYEVFIKYAGKRS